MKSPYIQGIVVAVVLGVGAVWIARNTYWEQVEERTWLTGEAAVNPFYSAEHLATALGARVHVRHETVGLPSPQAVIVLHGWNWSLIPERRERLERWVSAGGRLVTNNLFDDAAFSTWTGINQRLLHDNEKHGNLTCPPLTRGLTADGPALESAGTASHQRFNICRTSDDSELTTSRTSSWQLRDTRGHMQVVRVPIGRGSVTITNLLPFGNRDLLCGDSGLLFAAATQLRHGDEIEFLTEGDGGSLLGLLWNYGAPVIALGALLIALWLWRSGVRFGPLAATPDPARRSLAEQIRGTGQFTLRFGGGHALYAATVRALNEAAARRVAHYGRLSTEERVAALVRLKGLSSAELSAALGDPGARHPAELRKTIAVLEAARRQIEMR